MQNCIKCKILRWYLETICWIKLQCQYHSEHSLKCTTPGSHSMWAWITCRVTDVFGSVSGSDFSLSSVVFESLCSAPRTAPPFSTLLAFAYLVSVFNKDTVIEVLIKNELSSVPKQLQNPQQQIVSRITTSIFSAIFQTKLSSVRFSSAFLCPIFNTLTFKSLGQ